MPEKLLRGKQPLTMYRGASGTNGGYLYRGGVLEASQVDARDAERLVAENFLEWVVRKGEGFVLAEDTPTGSAGDPVVVGDTGTVPENETPDIGTINDGGLAKLEERQKADEDAKAAAAQSKAAAELAEKRAAAKAKLPADKSAPDGRAAQAVWVEYLVSRGSRYEDVKDVEKDELQKLAKQQS
jgi:hypothetical protein